jgi:hypothetical protein
MKNVFIFPLIIATLASCGGTVKKENKEEKSEKTTEAPTKANEPTSKSTSKVVEVEVPQVTANIDLTELQTNYDVKVGYTLTYSTNIHTSVGNEANVMVSDSVVLVQNESGFVYKNADNANMKGGDGGTRTYRFEAASPGKSLITIEKVFRGQVTDTYELTINVTE